MSVSRNDGIVRIDSVVAELEVWLDAELFPVPKMRVKVLQRSNAFCCLLQPEPT